MSAVPQLLRPPAPARPAPAAGDPARSGFVFQWSDSPSPSSWPACFRENSVNICLNLHGRGWVSDGSTRLEFEPDSTAFFIAQTRPLRGERLSGETHRFLNAQFFPRFFRTELSAFRNQLRPELQDFVRGRRPAAGSTAALTHRHRDLLKSVLRPPVLGSAQSIWYRSKALEFAAEFFFVSPQAEPICTRAQRLAAERVARAKTILADRLANPPTLDELGRLTGCSACYLSRTFTRETGLTLSNWLRRARLEKAAGLLKTGRANVTEAALTVGYSSLSHFSQAFHEMYGCCPGLYPLRTASQETVLGQPA